MKICMWEEALTIFQVAPKSDLLKNSWVKKYGFLSEDKYSTLFKDIFRIYMIKTL